MDALKNLIVMLNLFQHPLVFKEIAGQARNDGMF